MENEMTIDKIIEKSKQWTLEGDCNLLQWMNQISNNLEERVTKTSSAMNHMSTNLDRTSIALSNVTNNLAALQFSKFVENRVHDDDETLVNTANVPNKDVTDRKSSGEDIYTFLKKNVEMMNSCHEAYTISYEDSDDDDDVEPVTSVVYRSKNPYEARPLPHIYGSNLWKEKWHIGLCDSDNDFSGEENSEQFSESSSTADDSYESTAPTMSEWDSTAWGLNSQHNVERKDVHTPSNDGESSYQGEDYSQSKVSTPKIQRSIPTLQQPIQDQRYYQHVPRRQESLFDDIFDDSKPKQVADQVVPQVVPPQVIPTPHKKIIPESYIPNEPPPDEQSTESESNRRVGAKKTLNLFDDDEFSSFMDQIVQKASNKNIKPNEKPQADPESDKKDNDSQSQPKKALAPNSFDESNVHKQKEPSKILATNIFSDSDDLFSPQSEKTQEPPGKIISQNLFSDSDDLFTPSISEQSIVKRKSSSLAVEDDIFAAIPQSVPIIGKTKINNLFDDDDEDDEFDNIFSSKRSTSSRFSQATKNLFSDDIEPESKDPTLKDNVTIKEAPTTSARLFKDDENSLVLEIEKSTKSPSLKDVPNVPKSLFDDVNNSRIVEKEISSVLKDDKLKEGSLLKKGLFDDFEELEDENDIFSTKPAKKDNFENLFKERKSDNKLSTAQNNTLFGDEDEKKDTKGLESKNSELVEEIERYKPSDLGNILYLVGDVLTKEPPNDIAPSLNIRKTKVDDLFAEDVPDDFENFTSTNPSKSDKDNDEYSKITEHLTKPIAPATSTLTIPVPNPTDSAIITETTPRLPVIAQKPLVDKSSKLQGKVMSKKNLKADDSEKTHNENGTNRTTTIIETEKISSPHSKDPRPNLEPLDAPEISETTKTQITDISKLGSNLDMNESESSKAFKTKKDQFKNKVSSLEEEITPTKTVLKSNEGDSKPISKPKPKVFIAHDKVSSPSKEITNENLLADLSAKKPSTIPSYTSLFHDDIPPEDENPNPTSNEESPLHTVEEDAEVKPISSASSVPYNSINLFADVPPDDYFSVSTSPAAETKRIHSIFYDDFNETIEAGREMRTPPSYMINHEPPPDDKDNKLVSSEVKKEKPQVSKLKKMNFQINVGALLPSAKLPSFKKPETVEKSQSDILIKEHNTPSALKTDIVPNQLPSVKTRELPDNILPNLNKDRAKVQVQRRPSTRMGRQERYRKSIVEDTVSIGNEEENEIEIKKPTTPSSIQHFETRTQEIYSNITESNPEISKDENKIKSPVLAPAVEDLGIFDKKQEIHKMPDPETLFEESDNFFNKHVTSSSSSKATTTKLSSLFKNSDSTGPENIFETIKNIESNTKKSEPGSSPLSKTLDSLFDSDGIDENPFGTPKNFLPQSVTQKATSKPLEDNSRQDLRFKSVQQKEPKDQLFNTASKPPKEPVKTTPKSLFDDSDDGSDDIFKETRSSKKAVSHKKLEHKPKTKPLSKQAKPSASLFSSDEDSGSGDDIFGKSRTKPGTKKNEPVKDKAQSSLFADLSDDDSDGLFGTSTKKTIEVNKSRTNPPKNRVQPTKQPAQLQQAKAVSSNPLSDLLGP